MVIFSDLAKPATCEEIIMKFENNAEGISKLKPLIMGFAAVFLGFLMWVTTR